jgi:CBS domain containing-hemolysin-like protein
LSENSLAFPQLFLTYFFSITLSFIFFGFEKVLASIQTEPVEEIIKQNKKRNY